MLLNDILEFRAYNIRTTINVDEKIKLESNKFATYSLDAVNYWGLVGLGGVVGPHLFADQRPHFVDVDGGASVLVPLQVEMTHTDLSKVSRMVFVEVDPVVMLTTSVTATSRMLTVLT